MAKKAKSEATPGAPRAPRRRAATAAEGTPPVLPPEAMPEPAAALTSAEPAATASPEALAADELARDATGARIVREPAEERPGHERIAQRAYEIFEQRGGQPGRDLDDWLEAERQLAGQKA